jgi:hypothetical protein
MQPIGWYYRRLRKMSFDELHWRLKTLVRQNRQRLRYLAFRSIDLPAANLQNVPLYGARAGITSVHPSINDETLNEKLQYVTQQAVKHRQNKLDFFDLSDVNLGTPPQWGRDYFNNVTSQNYLAINIDYRDLTRNGDCKLVWEPNRHHQLVRLGLAYRITKQKTYALSLKEQLISWIKSCPYGFGMTPELDN